MKNDIYYVYHHIEPITHEIVYTGHGCKARAWTCDPGRGKGYSGGHRKPEHAAWCQQLMELGLTPADWVSIVISGLSKVEARKVEQDLINKYRPRFNYQLGDNFKLSTDACNRAFELREEGLSYNNIGECLGVSTMTIWRCLNNG